MREQLADSAPTVYRFLLRKTGDVHLAEDLMQECLLRAWKHRKQLRDPQRFKVWLLTIANNVWRDNHRRQHRVQTFGELPEDISPTVPSPTTHVSEREQVQMALEAMEDLPRRQREVLHLSVCEQLSLAEIAEVLQISTGTAKSSLSLARQKMRSRLRHLFIPEHSTNAPSESQS